MLFSLLVFISAVVYAGSRDDNRETRDGVEVCAKWLLGEMTDVFSTRIEAAKSCARGATVACAEWVLGSENNNYNNRLEAVNACATKPFR